MLIIPAIDLRDGKVVRLHQGDYAQETVYGDDPAEVAKGWMKDGIRWLHVVDLDGAKGGKFQHEKAVGQIVMAAVPFGTRIEVGGGIRDEKTIRDLFDLGVHRIILGTKASEDPKFRREMIQKYRQRIVIGIDAKGAEIAIQGWTSAGKTSLEAQGGQDYIGELLADGAKCMIYTDISRDGTLAGPSLERIQQLTSRLQGKAELIASGGVGSIEDLKKLKSLNPPPAAVIVGKALYEKKFTLAEALQA